jgi:hypothetical protein
MADLEAVKTPEARRDSHHVSEDQKDHAPEADTSHSANRTSRSAMSPGMETLKHIQFIEPAEGTPAALALAGTF